MVTETTEKEGPIINRSNHSEATIETWQAYFSQLYSERNKQFKGEMAVFIWLKVIEKATKVGEAIRKKNLMKHQNHLLGCFVGYVLFAPTIIIC